MARLLSSLPVGAKVKDINTKYNGKPIVWMVLDKNHSGYPSNSVTLLTEKIISLKSFDAKESGGNTDRRNYGNNRYLHSNIRQWLNKDTSPWYQSQHSYDNPPNNANVWSNYNEYDAEPGFLANFSNELKTKLLPTTLTVVKPSVDGGGTEQVTDKVFLLSRTEVGLGNENSAEGTPFSYFNSDTARQAYPTAEAVSRSEYTNSSLNTNQPWYWWLRTPLAGYAHFARYVFSSGSLGSSSAFNGHYGVRPALNLPSEILVSDTVDSDGAYVIQWNANPMISVNLENDFVMSEIEGQKEVTVSGSVTDEDANNTVTVKLQINNGTIRNIHSAVSDGSTPINFSKKLTYSNKRVYDGATPLSNDLAENTDHTLKVWAEDDQGGKSTVAERKFRVVHNRPPTISDSDRDLGVLIEAPSITYQVSDPEGHEIMVTEKINGQEIRSFETESGTEHTLTIPLEMWIPLQLEQHAITVEAMDMSGAKTTRTYTFTRTEDTILLELKNPFVTDIAAERILVTPDVYVPIGATIKIEACNNAFDEEPTWEDITGMAMANRGYNFINQTKTADKWGINIRFTLEKGTATQMVRLEGFGGAFD